MDVRTHDAQSHVLCCDLQATSEANYHEQVQKIEKEIIRIRRKALGGTGTETSGSKISPTPFMVAIQLFVHSHTEDQDNESATLLQLIFELKTLHQGKGKLVEDSDATEDCMLMADQFGGAVTKQLPPRLYDVSLLTTQTSCMQRTVFERPGLKLLT